MNFVWRVIFRSGGVVMIGGALSGLIIGPSWNGVITSCSLLATGYGMTFLAAYKLGWAFESQTVDNQAKTEYQ